MNGAPAARTPGQNRTVGRYIHRLGAELLVTVHQLGPATTVVLCECASSEWNLVAGSGSLLLVTPVDLQDLEASKKTGSLGGSSSGRTGSGVSSRSSRSSTLGLLVVRARLHDRTPRISSRAAEL